MRGKIHSITMLSAFVGLTAFMIQDIDARVDVAAVAAAAVAAGSAAEDRAA